MDVSCKICSRHFANNKALEKHFSSDAHLKQERYHSLREQGIRKKRKCDPDASQYFPTEACIGFPSADVQCDRAAEQPESHVVGDELLSSGEEMGAPRAVQPAAQQGAAGGSASLSTEQGAGQIAPPVARLHAPLQQGAAVGGVGGFAELFRGMCLDGTEGDLEAAEATAADQLLRMAQRSTLDPHVAVIASACLRLPAHLRDMLLKTLASKSFVPSMIPWRSAKDLASDLDSLQVQTSCMRL